MFLWLLVMNLTGTGPTGPGIILWEILSWGKPSCRNSFGIPTLFTPRKNASLAENNECIPLIHTPVRPSPLLCIHQALVEMMRFSPEMILHAVADQDSPWVGLLREPSGSGTCPGCPDLPGFECTFLLSSEFWQYLPFLSLNHVFNIYMCFFSVSSIELWTWQAWVLFYSLFGSMAHPRCISEWIKCEWTSGWCFPGRHQAAISYLHALHCARGPL